MSGEGQCGGQGVEGRDGGDGNPKPQGEALHRADPDPEAGEGAGADRHRQPLQLPELPAGEVKQVIYRRHQALGVGGPDVQDVLPYQPITVEERGPACQRGGFHGENSHNTASLHLPLSG